MGTMEITRPFAEEWEEWGPDNSEPVGALPELRQGSAMTVSKDVSGNPVYRKEDPIDVFEVNRLVMTMSRDWPIWRLEVSPGDSAADIQPGDFIVIARHPYSTGDCDNAALKQYSRKTGFDRPEVPEESLEDVLRWIDKQSHDIWDKSKRCVAGFWGIKNQAHWPRRNVKKKVLRCFGSCANFEDMVAMLLKSSHVTRLLDETERGVIRFTHWSGVKGSGDLHRVKLYDEVKEEAMSLMLLACQQALAGPHEHSDCWEGRLVVEKVDEIYRAHLNARNRKCAGHEKRFRREGM